MNSVEKLLQRTLVVRCQLGDRRALEELFLRFNRPLGYYLRQMMARDDIDDARQETWLTVLRTIGQLRSPEAFAVWLYRIAHNKAMSRLSGNASTTLLDEDAAADIPDDSDSDFDESDAARIHAELVHLGERHREVLLLRFIEDLSYEQMAEVIGCTVGTVRSRLHYAKAALRLRLESTS
jgi:RNA polymerase sigma-70 factor (ECF subfamily)